MNTSMAKEYWVYVNNSMKKAQLHNSKCSACKFGRVLKTDAAFSNDWWEGPFDSRDRAWESAESAAKKVGGAPSKCMMCRP